MYRDISRHCDVHGGKTPWFLAQEDTAGEERTPSGGQERRKRGEREKEKKSLNGVARRSVEAAKAGQVRFQRRDVSTEFQSKKLRTPHRT